MNVVTILLNEVKLVRPGGFTLKHLNLQLPPNAHLVITGPSGSGKTSLGMALAGKLFVTGKIEINPVTNDSTVITSNTKKVQMVEQRYEVKNRSNTVDGYYQQRYNSLDNEDAYTVMEELFEVLEDRTIIAKHLNEFNIGYLADKTLLTLSSGEHKRFQLVKMLLRPAAIVILDEPFVGLDIAARAALNNKLLELASGGTQIITLTGARGHFPDVATHVLELKQQDVHNQQAACAYFGVLEEYSPSFRPEVKRYDLDNLNLQRLPALDKHRKSSIIKMVDLHISYPGKVIFENLNWTVFEAESWLLKGPNGAGKSTLLSLIYGDNPKAYANEIYLFGKKRGTGESIWDIKRQMGYVSPELQAYFDKNISCFEAVASGYYDTMGLYRKLSTDQITQVDAWLDALSLTGVRNKKLAQVAAGQQRLIILLRAFIKRPALLILDEPCQGLDQWQSAAFVELVQDYINRTGASLIYISHYASEVPGCVGKVLELLGDGNGSYEIFEVNKFRGDIQRPVMLGAS